MVKTVTDGSSQNAMVELTRGLRFPDKLRSRLVKKRRSGMDIPLLKQFVLWRGEKRIVVGEGDLQTA